MKAVIMAGGEGTRLRPMTCNVPKPMIDFLGKPLMQYGVELLRRHGVGEIATTLMYRAQTVEEYFEDGSKFGVKMWHYFSAAPLGTAGSVKKCGAFLDESVFIISGDALTDVDLAKVRDYHIAKNCPVTIVLKRVENPLEYGIVLTDEGGIVRKFFEKPGPGEVFSDTANTGMYLIEPEIFQLIPEGRPFDFSKDLFPLLLKQGIPIAGYVMENYWCDVGSVETYLQAQEDALRGQVNLKIDAVNQDGVWMAKTAKVASGAMIEAPSYIGEKTVIGASAHIGAYSSIQDGAEVRPGANVKRSAVGAHTVVGEGAKVSHAVIGRSVSLGTRSRVFEFAVVGDNCRVENDATVAPKVRIWPEKWIEERSVVKQNIIWKYGLRRQLFSKEGIFLETGKDCFAHIAAYAGESAASALAESESVFVACAGDAGSAILAEAFCDGAALCGKKTILCEDALKAEAAVLQKDFGASLMFYIGPVSSKAYMIDTSQCSQASLRKMNQFFEMGEFGCCDAEEIRPVERIQDARRRYLGSLGTVPKEACFRIEGENDAAKLLREAANCAGAGTEEPLFEAVPEEDGSTGTIKNGMLILGGRKLELLLWKLGIDLYGASGGISIPPEAPEIARVIAQQAGVRYNGGVQSELREEFRRLFEDFAWACLKLAERLVEIQQSLEQYCSQIPVNYFLERKVMCGWNQIGKALRRICEEDHAEAQGGSVILSQPAGRCIFRGGASKPEIRIWIESVSAEAAEELCMRYESRLATLLKENEKEPN